MLLSWIPMRSLAFVGAALLMSSPVGAKVRVNGSTTVNPVVVEAAHSLRSETGMEILIDTVGGSSGGIAALGDGRADVAMSSRPLSDNDRARFPKVDFVPTRIGTDALALVVSRDVWDNGIRALSKEQVRMLYQGEIERWSALGGPAQRVVFFNKEPGRGTWEVFASWIYGDADAAPLVNHPEVGSNEEARNKVASTPGSITQLSAAWADGDNVFALALLDSAGVARLPNTDALSRGDYPLARELYLVTNREPAGDSRRLIDFILGPRGAEILRRHGYLPLSQSSSKSPSP